MDEYIDREAAIEFVKRYTANIDGETTLKCVAYALSKVPAEEVAPVVHGRWEETLVPDGYVQKASRVRKKCSVCGWTNACSINTAQTAAQRWIWRNNHGRTYSL